MNSTTWAEQRRTAIHLLRSGRTPDEVAEQLARSRAWVYKVQRRFQDGGWPSLDEQSRAPKHPAKGLSEATRQAICQARSELEAQASQARQLHYVGAQAIQARLRQKGITPLPSTASIERVVSAAGLTRPSRPCPTEVVYPHLRPTQPLQLCQVDIVPHFLSGGQAVACFNALDVVSRYPTCGAFLQRRSEDAVAFLLQVWQEIGLATYTQVDNEACFSGGFTHPGVLGRVVRVALWVGTELIFSPLRHPESNGYVERFHQDYNQHVWAETNFADVTAIHTQARWFMEAYRQSCHHTALEGRSPSQCHVAPQTQRLAMTFRLPSGKLPLTEGRIHFIRRVLAGPHVKVLNLDWNVPTAQVDQGVWVTLDLTPHGATLTVYDAAPDVGGRQCLARHPFPLSEPVQARRAADLPASPTRESQTPSAPATLLAEHLPIRASDAPQTSSTPIARGTERPPNLLPSVLAQLATEARLLLQSRAPRWLSTMF